MELENEVFSSAGVQGMETSRNQVSDLEDFDFHWEHSDLNIDTVFPPGIDTPFAFKFWGFRDGFNDWKFFTDEEGNENSLPPSTPASDAKSFTGCWKILLLEQEFLNFLNMFLESCLKVFLLVWCMWLYRKNVFLMFHFHHNLLQKAVRKTWSKNSSRSVFLILLVATSLRLYQVGTEKKVGQHCKIKN